MNRVVSQSSKVCRCVTARSRQYGLSLIELMIATLLSFIIIAALTTLFGDISRSNREMAKTNSQIENARFAMQFLRNDLVHAGYWNSFVPEFDDLTLTGVPTDYPTLVPDPCLPFTSWPDITTPGHVDALLGIPLQVYSGTAVGTCGSGGIVASKVPDTDVLVVRHADTCAVGELNCAAFNEDELFFLSSNCTAEIESGNDYSLDPNSLTEMDCVTRAGQRRFRQTIYYIRDYAEVGDGIPTLVRSEFGYDGSNLVQLDPEPLVEGIERFRVELGVDLVSDSGEAIDPAAAIVWADEDEHYSARNRGDGVPEEPFIHCGSGCTPAQLANTVVVRLYLLARANQPTAGYVDGKTYSMGGMTPVAASALPSGTGYKRHVFSTTVRLNNVAGRRETPDPNSP